MFTDELLEKCAEAVHKAYCKYYLKNKGIEYWTKGEYSLLDEQTKQIDRETVKAVFEVLDENNVGKGKMIFNVTKKHIDNGVPGMCNECPVALCLLEHYDHVLVTDDTGIIVWMEGGNGEMYQVPDSVERFICKFDNPDCAGEIKPFRFELPEEFEVCTDPESLT